MATGNLVAQYVDFDLPGQGLNLKLTRTYNAQADAIDGPLGKGWSLGVLGGGTLASGTDTQFDFYDADGTKHHFLKVGLLGAWQSPPGVNLRLSDGQDLAGKWVRATRPDGIVYEFRLIAGSYRLNTITDRKANNLTLAYDTAGKLQTITDVKGRALTFTWTGGYLSKARFTPSTGSSNFLDVNYSVNTTTKRLTSATEAAGTSSARTTNFSYNADGLSSVTDPRGNPTGFTVAQGRLTQMTDRAGKAWRLFYDDPAGCPPTEPGPGVRRVCLTDPEGATSVWSSVANNLIDSQDAGDVAQAGPDGARKNHKRYVWKDNRVVKQTDESNNTKTFDYNANGQITKVVTDGANDPPVVTVMTYRDSLLTPGVSDLTDSDAAFGTHDQRHSHFEVDLLTGVMNSSTDPTGAVTSYAYYTRGLLKSITDPNNKTTTYGETTLSDGGYHASGQPTKITDPTGASKTLQYDYLGRNTQVSDRAGKIWSYEYDLRGNQTKQTDPLGRSTLHCFDDNDNETLVIRPKQTTQNCTLDETTAYVTKKTFDPRDLLSSTKTKSDTQLRKSVYNYYDDGELKEILEPRSFDPSTGATLAIVQKASYLRYPNNRVSAFIDEEGNQTDTIYTPEGLPQVVTDPPNSDAGTRHTMTYSYNWRGQVVSELESGKSQPSVNIYNLHGEKITTKTPKGNTTATNYDKMSRPIQMINAEGKISTRTYDPAGNLTSLAQPTGIGASTTTNYAYTSRNEIATETDPSDPAHTIDYSYDPEGRQTLRQDKYNGAVERNHDQSYNDDGKLAQSIASSPSTTAGRLETAYGYDANGNQTSVAAKADGAASTNVSSLSPTYTTADEMKILSETIYPPSGAGVTKASNYAYAQDGLLTERTIDGKSTSYEHSLSGQQKKATPWSQPTGNGSFGNGSFNWTYQPSGVLREETTGNGMRNTFTFDQADRMTSKMVDVDHIQQYQCTKANWEQITYDDDDNRLSEKVTLAQTGGRGCAGEGLKSGTGTYSYDRVGRLTSNHAPFDDKTVPYAYDDAGNVLSETGFSYAYQNNRLIRRQALPTGDLDSYSYDHFGNQTTQSSPAGATTTTYDAASHTKRVTSPDATWVEYAYDGLGRQVRRQDSTGAVTLFFRDQFSDQITLETNSTGGPTARYVLDSAGDAVANETSDRAWERGTYMSDTRSNLVQMSEKDHLVTAVLGYDPFGKEKPNETSKIGNWDSRLRFQMSPKDPKTGAYALGPRMFDPSIYRFVGADTFVASSANLDLQIDALTGNRYLYAGSNPANLIDDGHEPRSSARERRWCVPPWRWGKCRTARRLADQALTSAQRTFPPETLGNGRGDAYRHCLWSGEMTLKLGASTAKGFGDRHEQVSDNPSAERHMDLSNNAKGRDFARRIRGANGASSPADSPGSLRASCRAAANNGQLIVLKPG